MTQRSDRAEQLFLRVVDLAAGDQQAAIDHEAGDDPTLAAEVRALIAAHARTGEFDRLLGALGLLPADPGSESSAGDPLGRMIGPYRLLRRLGQGGMGTVYLAERADGQFEHRVAVKLLRPDRDIDDLKRRFLTERQILAQLVHNNIALLLDGSVTADGLPYLVMEFVDGRPLLDHCDGGRLSVEDRLALFMDICSAVDCAHRHLIVHRDLKPGNILVTADGGVKLLDFGIAKLLDPVPAVPIEATRTGQRVMTPEYASPEQVLGVPVGTASDVYQLGVLLYQLLTGRHPFWSGNASRADVERAIVSLDPVRPSTVPADSTAPEDVRAAAARARGATTRRLCRQIAGDLDHIVLKALRKEPDRRYGTVREFADDIRRHLSGLPVLARHGTLRYRAGRFVRRHRATVAGGAVALLLVAAGVVSTVWQGRRAAAEARVAQAERDRARLEAAKAAQIGRLLTGMFDVASEGGVRTDTLRLLPVLEAAVDRLAVDLADQPGVQAATLIAVSDLYEKLGRYDDALRAARAATTLRRSTIAPPAELGEALDNLGGVFMLRGELAAAESAWTEGLALRRSLVADSARGTDTAAVRQLATSLHNVAVAGWRQRRLAAADSLETEAIARYEQAGLDSTTQLASSLDLLALIRRDLGRKADMLPLAERALAIRRAALSSPHVEIAVSLNNLASALQSLGRLDEAEPLFRESLDIRKALLGDEHPQVATGIHNIGALMSSMGRTNEAIDHYGQALAMRRRLLDTGHLDIATSLSSLALLYHDANRCVEALPLLAEAVPLWRRGLRPDHGLVHKTLALIGHCHARLGDFKAAERDLLTAHRGLMTSAGPDHAETRRAAGFLRELYAAWNKPTEAARYPEPQA